MGLGSSAGELRWQSHGNDRPAVRYLCLINSTLLKIIYEGVCVHKTDSAPWYPSTPQPPFTSALQVQSIYPIYFRVHSFWFPKHHFEWFFSSPFIYFFCSEYAWVLFVLSGLLQIKEQTNRSRMPCLRLYDWEAFTVRYSAISKGHQLPWLWAMRTRAGQKAGGLWDW